jgi:hypothetical protein
MIKRPENLIAVIVSVLPATNCRCIRVKLELPRWSKKKVIPMQSSYKEESAIAYIAKHGVVPIAKSSGKHDSAILLYSFEGAESVLKAFN